MKKERIIIGLVIAAVVIALYYYLKGSGQATQVVYPNTQASGQPASQNPASTWNIQAPQVGPSPAAIYAPAPNLPATPPLQYTNYAPLNIYQITNEYAAAVPSGGDKQTLPNGTQVTPGSMVAAADSPVATVPSPAGSSSCSCGSCGSCSSSCPSCPTGGTYLDGNQASCLASNSVQQAAAPSASMVWTAANLQSFFGSVQ